MRAPHRRSLHLFLAGEYEGLYAGAAGRLPAAVHHRPRVEPSVYLCEGRHHCWALIAPADRYRGRVELSNALPMGAVVKSKKAWPYAAARRFPGSPHTFVTPRSLQATWRPPVEVRLASPAREPVYLCEGRHRYWALVAPADRTTGRVRFSNVLPTGAIVKSEQAWCYAAMRRDPDSPQTVVSPRHLRTLWLPLPPRKGGKGRRFAPTHELALVA